MGYPISKVRPCRFFFCKVLQKFPAAPEGAAIFYQFALEGAAVFFSFFPKRHSSFSKVLHISSSFWFLPVPEPLLIFLKRFLGTGVTARKYQNALTRFWLL